MRAGKIGQWRLSGVMLARAGLLALAGAGLCAGGSGALAKTRHPARHAASRPVSGGADLATSPGVSGNSGVGLMRSGQSGPAGMSDAEKLRRLDIMLLVTGLRCRSTVDDFQPDFQSFEAHHRRELNAADKQLRLQFAGHHGGAASSKAMDHINVEMANVYGNGHPWLGCHDLKGVVEDLAQMAGTRPMLVVADQLLASPTITAQP